MPSGTTRAAAVLRLQVAALLSAVQAIAASPPPFVGPPAPPIVRYEDGRVTMSTGGESLSLVLERLARAAEMRLYGTLRDDRPISLELDGVPFREAVERLLVGQNFTLRFAANGTPRRLTLRGAPMRHPPPTRGGRAPVHHRRRISFWHRWGGHPPIAIAGPLARAVGSAEARLPRIAQATGAPDAVVRRAAMRRVLSAIESDAELRAGLSEMTAADIARFAKVSARQHAAELAAYLAGAARDGQVRRRAIAALTTLR